MDSLLSVKNCLFYLECQNENQFILILFSLLLFIVLGIISFIWRLYVFYKYTTEHLLCKCSHIHSAEKECMIAYSSECTRCQHYHHMGKCWQIIPTPPPKPIKKLIGTKKVTKQGQFTRVICDTIDKVRIINVPYGQEPVKDDKYKGCDLCRGTGKTKSPYCNCGKLSTTSYCYGCGKGEKNCGSCGGKGKTLVNATLIPQKYKQVEQPYQKTVLRSYQVYESYQVDEPIYEIIYPKVNTEVLYCKCTSCKCKICTKCPCEDCSCSRCCIRPKVEIAYRFLPFLGLFSFGLFVDIGMAILFIYYKSIEYSILCYIPVFVLVILLSLSLAIGRMGKNPQYSEIV